MNSYKKGFGCTLKSIKKDKLLNPVLNNLKNKTYIVSGGTSGIGLSISKKLSSLGANVAIFGKTIIEHPKLEGTIMTAVNEIKSQHPTSINNTIGLYCDIRNPNAIENCIETVVSTFGGLDGVILNANTLCLNNTLNRYTEYLGGDNNYTCIEAMTYLSERNVYLAKALLKYSCMRMDRYVA